MIFNWKFWEIKDIQRKRSESSQDLSLLRRLSMKSKSTLITKNMSGRALKDTNMFIPRSLEILRSKKTSAEELEKREVRALMVIIHLKIEPANISGLMKNSLNNRREAGVLRVNPLSTIATSLSNINNNKLMRLHHSRGKQECVILRHHPHLNMITASLQLVSLLLKMVESFKCKRKSHWAHSEKEVNKILHLMREFLKISHLILNINNSLMMYNKYELMMCMMIPLILKSIKVSLNRGLLMNDTKKTMDNHLKYNKNTISITLPQIVDINLVSLKRFFLHQR